MPVLGPEFRHICRAASRFRAKVGHAADSGRGGAEEQVGRGTGTERSRFAHAHDYEDEHVDVFRPRARPRSRARARNLEFSGPTRPSPSQEIVTFLNRSAWSRALPDPSTTQATGSS